MIKKNITVFGFTLKTKSMKIEKTEKIELNMFKSETSEEKKNPDFFYFD